MVSGQPWDLSNINLSDHHECLQFEDAWTFIKIEDNFDRNLPSKEIKVIKRKRYKLTDTIEQCFLTWGKLPFWGNL